MSWVTPNAEQKFLFWSKSSINLVRSSGTKWTAFMASSLNKLMMSALTSLFDGSDKSCTGGFWVPWSHKVDTDELKMCVIISGVGSNRFSLSTSSSLTQQAFGVSHELEFKTPSDDVCALMQISYVEKEYQEFRGRHIIQVPVVVHKDDSDSLW